MYTDIQQIQKALENAFDIPFHVEKGMKYDDPWYLIFPDYSNGEIFEIKISYRQQLRMTMEMKPQKYAALIVKDMCNASKAQKNMFQEYAKVLLNNKANVELLINQQNMDPLNAAQWPGEWTSVSCRISRSPIIAENEIFNAVNLTIKWTLVVFGMFLSLLNIVPNDEEKGIYSEGKKERVQVNRYERNPLNRELCLAANGYDCRICGMNFERTYGIFGHQFIHVHHIIPVSKMGGEYMLNPVTDLVPVCPNCHSMLHRQDPPLLPHELQQILNKNKK